MHVKEGEQHMVWAMTLHFLHLVLDNISKSLLSHPSAWTMTMHGLLNWSQEQSLEEEISDRVSLAAVCVPDVYEILLHRHILALLCDLR